MIQLSEEQQEFIDLALAGNHILVDACIGSGKTTAIQALCNALPTQKKILYLTYNKLLKLDAKSKIHNSNCIVTNYHGYAYSMLIRAGIKSGMSDLIQTFLRKTPPTNPVDVLILDEYQDIEQELAEMLTLIKDRNPGLQIIAVGDMAQKIYDKTTLNVPYFIHHFLDDYIQMDFTKCFRLSADHAAMLGRIWQKEIHGVNEECRVKWMSLKDARKFLETREPEEILCLGSRTGDMATLLNKLEREYPEKFNKETVYASIQENGEGATEPKPTSAVFTTFDSSKGMERKICMVFDFTLPYWVTRASQPMQSYEILRNIFCVAASRGKERIIFVTKKKAKETLLTEQVLSRPFQQKCNFRDMDISSMYDFKYKEDVEDCFHLLKIKKIHREDNSIIPIMNADGLIDLSPCIGIYQEAMFFQNYDIDQEFIHRNSFLDDGVTVAVKENATLEEKILSIVSYDTKQHRYINQVEIPFVPEEEARLLKNRLFCEFSSKEQVQTPCAIVFRNKRGEELFTAKGRADVIRNQIVYELKFVNELSHEMFLQCASYVVALGLPKGILWNVRDNTMYEIKVPNREKFLNQVRKTITKGAVV